MARAHGDRPALSSDRAAFLWDPALASHVYRADHPLKPRRLTLVHDTLASIGAFARSNSVMLAPREATQAELEQIAEHQTLFTVRWHLA